MGNTRMMIEGLREVDDSNVGGLGHALEQGQGVVADHLASVDPDLADHGVLQCGVVYYQTQVTQ